MPRGKHFWCSKNEYSCESCDYKATNKKAIELHMKVTHKSEFFYRDKILTYHCLTCEKLLKDCKC